MRQNKRTIKKNHALRMGSVASVRCKQVGALRGLVRLGDRRTHFVGGFVGDL